MLTYTIQCIDREKSLIYFVEVQGYKLQNGLAAHRSETSKLWILDDLNSGCKIQDGFHTFSNLKANLEASDIQKRIFEIRKSERYALLVRRNREKKTIKLNKKTKERKETLWEI